jgi:hypothetical protein
VGKHVLVDGIVHELPYAIDFDIDHATGLGVFMRAMAYVTEFDYYYFGLTNAQGAWDNSGWNKSADKDLYNAGCWYAGGTDYQDDRVTAMLLWDLTVKTAAQDAFNGYLSIPAKKP